MIGAIVGDIAGSVYEGRHLLSDKFKIFVRKDNLISGFVKNCVFTGDTVLTIATMEALTENKSYAECYRNYYKRYPKCGYGSAFKKWAKSDSLEGYDSYGNGSAMRVSPIAFAFETLDEVVEEAEKSAIVTHNHPEGIKGAKAIASAIFLSRQGVFKDHIKKHIEDNYGYDLDRTHDEMIKDFTYDISCQATVPLAIISFLNSNSYIDCIRKSMQYGADTDTLACMAGSIAQTRYPISENITLLSLEKLDMSLKTTMLSFMAKYAVTKPNQIKEIL